MTFNVATQTRAIGLLVRERNPAVPDFGHAHTAYYPDVWEAVDAAQDYPLDQFELAIVFEELSSDGWKVVDIVEVE